MARLLIHVEGPTEENFVNEVLRNHLFATGYHSVSARIMGNARLRQHRGGICGWPSAKRDIVHHLMEDADCVVSTFVDYYGLPQTGAGGWPGRSTAGALTTTEAKARCVQDSLAADMSNRFDQRRFVPFVVMHEFEGLLFSDCAAFSRGIFRAELESWFQSIRDQFATPEEINDSPMTAPSKRIQEAVPGYQKPLLGVLAALEIGLVRIRAECPHFNSWMTRLESLAQSR
jgi:hypothetical protein